MTPAKQAIERGLELFAELVSEDAALAHEFETSRRAFFRGPPPVGERDAELAGRRHLEWFLMERHSPALQGLPAEALREPWTERAGEDELEFGESFVDSRVGIYEVTDVRPGVGAWLHDLAAHGEYPIEEPEGSKVLASGDLVVGRVFPLGNSLYHVSSAAGFIRDAEVLKALRADIDRARDGRRGVLRLAQSELESMFWGGAARPPVDPVVAARGLLHAAGVADEEVDAILADLAARPFEEGDATPGAADGLGAILDRLAFETSVDLDLARGLLVDAWRRLSAEGPGAGPSLTPQRPSAKRAGPRAARPGGAGAPTREEVERAIAEFDRGRAQGEDLERLFASLEESLALDAEAEVEDDTVPDFPGVVAAMVEEFLWETEREQGAQARAELEGLRLFGRWASHVGVFENLAPRDVLAFVGLWLPESDALDNAEDARRMLHAVRRFCRWSTERQHVPIQSRLTGALDGLLSSLPRIAEANRRRTRRSGIEQGEVHLLAAVDEGGRGARVVDAGGAEHTVAVDPDLLTWLRAGDRVRARRTDGRLAVYCCYPPEVALLRELEADAATAPGEELDADDEESSG